MIKLRLLRALFASVGMGATVVALAAQPLPSLKIDKSQTTVSGLSSGGFMAVQLHVAYSADFKKGAGVIAGGPFYCAQGSVLNATGRCMASPSGIPVSTLVNLTNDWASQGLIDPLSNLQDSRIYLFSGSLDSAVKTGVMDKLQSYYSNVAPSAQVLYKKDLAAEHAMVTDDYGSACSVKAAPYINNCNFDLAGKVLQHLYGPLNPRNTSALPEGNFIEFNQSAFVNGHGMASTGWAYVPQACQAGGSATCRLHVVLHGCKQNVNDVQQQYVRNTGYNRWGDSNNIVMLYPQTSLAATNSCWDWWGYDSADYAKKSGPQMAAIKAMVDQISAGGSVTPPPADLPAPTGVAASGATSSTMDIAWNAVTGADGYNVYRNGAKTNALPVTSTTFTDTGLVAATSYSWTVKAIDAEAREGVASAPATGTTTGAPNATCFTASNYAHTVAGRAYAWFGFTYANGSGDGMGWWNIYTTSTLKMTGAGYYEVGTCP
jgi:poly(3-hydroxybutyrate) depolymerase